MNMPDEEFDREQKEQEKREYFYVIIFAILFAMTIGFALLIAKLRG